MLLGLIKPNKHWLLSVKTNLRQTEFLMHL